MIRDRDAKPKSTLGASQRRGLSWQLRNFALVHRLETAGSIAFGDEEICCSRNILQVLNISTLLPRFKTN
jgi:hypothetical protein